MQNRIPINTPLGLAGATLAMGLFLLMVVPVSAPVDVQARVVSAREVTRTKTTGSTRRRVEEWRIDAVISSSPAGGPASGDRVQVQDSCIGEGEAGDTIGLRCTKTAWTTMTGGWSCSRPAC